MLVTCGDASQADGRDHLLRFTPPPGPMFDDFDVLRSGGLKGGFSSELHEPR
jgi:hypothetical protein